MTQDLSIYIEAIKIVMIERIASTSYLQKKLQIGYNFATQLIEKLERQGIVSAANHVGKREVLKPENELEAVLYIVTGSHMHEIPATGPVLTFECSGCDVTAKSAPDTMPKGWHRQVSPRLGDMYRCPACSAKNAVKIATSTMTTEEILNHKSGDEGAATVATSAQNQLRTYLERFNRLFDEMQDLSADVSVLKKEAKELGFDTKILIKVVRESRKDQATRAIEKEVFDLYASAVGLE